MTTPTQTGRLPEAKPAIRWWARAALVVYAVALVLAVLTPTSTDQAGVVLRATDLLLDLGVPSRFATFDRVEMLANVAMVVPVGFLGVLSYPGTRWQSWTAYAFLGSLTVELVQGFLLPAREAATSDVVANTLGALIGASASRILVVCRARRVTR